MQSSRDSSLWRSLAVAFGDGLAFGVGVKLSQAAGRQLAAPQSSTPVRSDPTPLTERVEQIEQNLKRIDRAERTPMTGSSAVDQKVLEAIINALEARLAEHAGQAERRVADLEARLAIELRSLDQQDDSISRRAAEDIAALQQEMVGVNREFGEAVARIVADQVASQVQARAAALEQALPAKIALAVEADVGPRLASVRGEFQESLSQVQARVAALEQGLPAQIALAVQAAVETRLPAAMRAGLEPIEQQLRAELEAKDREIAELRQRLADTDSNVLELILGIGQICRQAARKLGPPVASAESGPAQTTDPGVEPAPAAAENVEAPESEYDAPLPGFAQSQKPSRLWRVPLVSSLVLTTGGLVLRHFLY